MKAISKKSISFPSLGFGMTEGVVTELPEDTESCDRILEEADIEVVTEKVSKQLENNINE